MAKVSGFKNTPVPKFVPRLLRFSPSVHSTAPAPGPAAYLWVYTRAILLMGEVAPWSKHDGPNNIPGML